MGGRCSWLHTDTEREGERQRDREGEAHAGGPARSTYSAQSANQLTSLVIDLSGVRFPEEDADTGISALYLSQENNEMFVTLIKQLREGAEIKVFTDLL